MNSASDTLLNKTEDQVEASRRQGSEAEQSAALVDLGRVTETKGGFFGPKLDNGAGLLVY